MSGGKIVQSVPNFSEGRNDETVQAIASAIRGTGGCSLLGVDAGVSTNRTVYTFCGSPVAVVEGALQAARTARKLINMANHRGEHPRMGTMDVCPFVPVSNVTMMECVEISYQFGHRLAEELKVPVYLYEEAQDKEYRKMLSQIRKGEYEGLREKLLKPEWAPDYGPAEFVSEWGATVTGARPFLIAYNINLLGTKQQAHRIALDMRETGRGPNERGLFKQVKGLGWYIAEQDVAQVSLNLCNYNVTSLHMVFEECCKIAKSLNVAVVGSEIVGLVPLGAILVSANYYMEKEDLFILHEHQKIRLAVDRLGLNSISEFKPQEKVIEYSIGCNEDGPLVSGSVRSIVEKLGSRTSSPGGGSAAACIASMVGAGGDRKGAALGTMVGLLTFGNRKFAALDGIMRGAVQPLYTAMQQMIPLIDKDTEVFTEYMDALQLPKSNTEEKTKRQEAVWSGLKKAIEVPLTVMRLASGCWPHLAIIAQHGNITALSDIQIAAHSLDTGLRGAYYNVAINLKQVKDEEYISVINAEVEGLVNDSSSQLEKVLNLAKSR